MTYPGKPIFGYESAVCILLLCSCKHLLTQKQETGSFVVAKFILPLHNYHPVCASATRESCRCTFGIVDVRSAATNIQLQLKLWNCDSDRQCMILLCLLPWPCPSGDH